MTDIGWGGIWGRCPREALVQWPPLNFAELLDSLQPATGSSLIKSTVGREERAVSKGTWRGEFHKEPVYQVLGTAKGVGQRDAIPTPRPQGQEVGVAGARKETAGEAWGRPAATAWQRADLGRGCGPQSPAAFCSHVAV